MVREYRVGMWERGRGEMVMGWRERQADLAREVRVVRNRLIGMESREMFGPGL